MSEATLTGKGQMNIPADTRRSMAIAAKDRITFIRMLGENIVMQAKTKPLVDLKGVLKPLPYQAVTLSEMNLGSAYSPPKHPHQRRSHRHIAGQFPQSHIKHARPEGQI